MCPDSAVRKTAWLQTPLFTILLIIEMSHCISDTPILNTLSYCHKEKSHFADQNESKQYVSLKAMKELNFRLYAETFAAKPETSRRGSLPLQLVE